MTKAKRILALVLALVMVITVFTTTGVAKTALSDYTEVKSNPTKYFNGVQKIEFNAEQGACWLLDLLDDLLYKANINFQQELSILGTLKVYIRNIDELFWTLYNLGRTVKMGSDAGSCAENVGLKSTIVNLAKIVSPDFGHLEDLVLDALGNQNSDSRPCRGVPNRLTVPDHGMASNGVTDIEMVSRLLWFLSDNRNTVLAHIPQGDLNLQIKAAGINVYNIKDALPGTIAPFLNNLGGALKDLLYTKLWNSDAEAAPSGWTIDTGIQQLVNWLLISGTGDSASDGGKSILGSGFEAFLPAIDNQPGKAYVDDRNIQADRGNGVQTYKMNFYQLVNNALNALLSGFVSDKLYDLLIDLLGIDDSDGLGDASIMTDMMFSLILGIIEGLCVANGAPAINYSNSAQNYPVPRIRELLDWFFTGGGLRTFVEVNYTGIRLTDNFVQLLRDVLRLLPSLVPLLGIEYPAGLIHSVDELTAKKVDEVLGAIYTTYEGEEIYLPDPDDDTYYEYVTNNQAVNTTDPSRSDYRNPTFIREAYILPESTVWADILKVVLNYVIDGCYFPEWADTIAEVGAYGLASLAAAYLPENNYFDRLDAYHYEVELNESYTPKGTSEAVTPLAYTESFVVSGVNNNQPVTVPRAAADIGASLGAFFLNGAFSMGPTLGFVPETDTNFESFLAEFLLWGAKKYMPLFTGNYDSSTGTFKNLTSWQGASIKGTWQDRMNSFIAAFNDIHTSVDKGSYVVNTTPAESVRAIIYPLIDNTLFQLIPMSWLPKWVGNGGSSAIFNYWLGDSLIDMNLQQIVSLLQTNPDGELEKNSVVKVIINLLDRILGALLGGNAVLPTCAESNNRSVFSTATSLANLESFIANNSTLKTFLTTFLFYLNRYGLPLLSTALPIIAGLVLDTTKAVSYKELGASQEVQYISNSDAITVDELKEYAASYSEDTNTILFNQRVNYPSSAKADTVAKAIGLSEFSGQAVGAGGGVVYYVDFPASYDRASYANAAAEYASEYFKSEEDLGHAVAGTECYVASKRVDGKTTYRVLQKMDYKSGTATLNKSYVYGPDGTTVTETIYNYTNFNRAVPTTRSGSRGTVAYSAGAYGSTYVLIDRDDYTTNKICYLNRRNNAVEDAQEFIGEYDEYIQTLCGAYGSWLMYLVNLQLFKNNLYDKDDNGVIDKDSDNNVTEGYPNQPDKKTPYPFAATTGNATNKNWVTNESYAYNYANSSPIVQAAIDYSNEVVTDDEGQTTNHDIELSNGEKEAVVRLALGSIAFDITKDANGDYNSGSKQWADLTATEKSTITTKCTALGLSYDGEETITRKAFKLFGGSNGGYSNFGNIAGSGLSFTPITDYNLNADGDLQEAQNDLHESYIAFAKSIKEFDNGVKEHYDEISWRAAIAENQISTSFKLNALEWALKYTRDAYYPAGETNGRNKKYNLTTGNLESAYSKNSFTPFQMAYDYAECLKNYINGGGHDVTQSLISEAYRHVMKFYNQLSEFSGTADWEELLGFIEQANTILNSEIGLDANGHAKNTDCGYTETTLLNLRDAVEQAQALYDEFALTYDSDYQQIVDDERDNLSAVIAALDFYGGSIPDVLISTQYDGDVSKIVYHEPDENDITKIGVLIGFAEGSGLEKSMLDEGTFVPTGYTLSETLGNTIEWQPSGRGNGTGAYIMGKVGGLTYVTYYCVIKGDINGDTRIDGNDKVVVDSVLAQQNAASLDPYIQVAADVDNSGTIDSTDVNIIKAHYRYETYGDITGEISQNGTHILDD